MKTAQEMIQAKPGFPRKWSDDDLKKVSLKITEEFSAPIGIRWLPVVEAYFNLAINELAERNSRRSARASFLLSFFAICLAGIGIFLSVRSDRQSKGWESYETQLLEEIRDAVRAGK